MRATYNLVAGQSLDRLAALSDGLFAIAMTLLVLNLHIPASGPIHSEQDLWRALLKLAPNLVTFILSFLTLGIFWVGQQTQLQQFERSDRDLSWIHLAFLLTVSLMPFSTALLTGFITYRIALLTYWMNIVLPGSALFASLLYASHAGLWKEDVTDDFKAAGRRRVIVAQGLYAFGALLCVISTYWSIAFIVLVQLNYVFAPRIGILYKL